MPGHHLTVFIVPAVMVKHEQRLLGWRYLVSTPAQTFDAYAVWEQLSVNPLPVVTAIYLGTVLQLYGRALSPSLNTMYPWHHGPSFIARRIMPMAKEYHDFKNYWGTVDCYDRDAWTPAKCFILYRCTDVCDSSQWYLSRFYLNARFVHAPAWDFERPRL